MKQLTSFLLALVLAAGVLVTPALAAGEAYTFTLTVNGAAEAAVQPGDTVTVALQVRNNQAGSIELYGMQDYISFDPEYLAFVEGSEELFSIDGYPVISGSILPGNRQVFTNRAGLTPIPMENGAVIISFQLRALKDGLTAVTSSGPEMLSRTAEKYSVELLDARVKIGNPHIHTMQPVAEKPATETAPGMKAHWVCTGCGKLFADEQGTQEVTAEALTIPMLPPAEKPDVQTPAQPQKPAEPAKPTGFVDVPADTWFADAVNWAVEKGVTTGVSADAFGPEIPCTRSQAVTFLWRAAGAPAPKGTQCPFADVSADAWYRDAVVWAVENGITDGVSPGVFAPELPCTRSQIVTFLWRTEGMPQSAGAASFADVPADAWYRSAVAWAVEAGVTQGVSQTAFAPELICTRSQIVTFLQRAD